VSRRNALQHIVVPGYPEYSGSHLNRLLPRSLFALSKTFFDKSKACSRRFALGLHFVRKLALRAQTVQIADLLLRQDLLAKNVLMTAQRNSCLGNNLLIIDIISKPTIQPACCFSVVFWAFQRTVQFKNKKRIVNNLGSLFRYLFVYGRPCLPPLNEQTKATTTNSFILFPVFMRNWALRFGLWRPLGQRLTDDSRTPPVIPQPV